MGDCCCKQKVPAAMVAAAAAAAGAAGEPHKAVEPALVDRLVIEMLTVAASRVDSDAESPAALVRLHAIADAPEGWLQVVASLVAVVPLEHPFGPAAIALLLDECPLPARHTALELTRRLALSAARAQAVAAGGARAERNICAALGCVADKLAGPTSAALLTADTLDYLLACLSAEREPCVALFALIALQKFARTADCRRAIRRRLDARAPHPLLALEPLAASDDCARRQLGFCARWALDNLFPAAGRRASHEAGGAARGALLDWRGASEHLQIACDGLEARCDAYSFESVRCTFRADGGRWYYEATLVTAGVMQIGWATRDCRFASDEGYGVGDDAHSVAYDGCRRLLWHDARPTPAPQAATWRAGDVLGCLLDLCAGEAVFALNGRRLPPCRDVFRAARSGFYAAASFMAYQQCRFNFGSEPFKFPPGDRPFEAFDDHGTLTDDQRKVIPRRLYLEQLRCSEVREDCCTICCDDAASCVLEPCGHGGFCSACTAQLRECPLCRADILRVKREPE